jgi:hypothetical protein
MLVETKYLHLRRMANESYFRQKPFTGTKPRAG